MDERIGSYQRARRKFALIVYLLTLLWLVLALAQWVVISTVDVVGDVFRSLGWISIIFFTLSIMLSMLFIFVEKTRFVPCLNWLIAFLIVEFVILGVYALAARTVWPDMLLWFGLCVLLMYMFVLIGAVVPHDLTLDVVILFVISFVFLIISVFLVMLFVLTGASHSFFLYQIFISIVVLMFVMYHAQTINGGRFAEMRINDYLLATIILFYDFIVIFLLTFYVQTKYRWLANEFLSTTIGNTSTTTTTMLLMEKTSTTITTREQTQFENIQETGEYLKEL